MRIALVALLVSCTVVPAAAQRRSHLLDDAVKQARRLVQDQRHSDALKLLESAYIKSFHGRSRRAASADRDGSVEFFLLDLYRKNNELARGVETLWGEHRESEISSVPLRRALIDAALEGGRVEIARELAGQFSQRTDTPDEQLRYARAFAAAGDSVNALVSLRRYLEYEFSESRALLIGYREFARLAGNREFASLVTETDVVLPYRYERFRREESKPLTLGRDQLKVIAAVYKNVVDPSSERALGHELSSAERQLTPYLRPRLEVFLSLLRDEEAGTYYRLSMARMIATVIDSARVGQLVEALEDDDCTDYPEQLFRLAHRLACVNPQAARPFLRQLLGSVDGSVDLADGVPTNPRAAMLLQAFGAGGDVVVQDLVEGVESSNSTVADNAIGVLVALQEPRAIGAIVDAYESESDPARRRRLLAMLAEIQLPETVAELNRLKADAAGEELQLIEAHARTIKEPEADPFPDDDGIAVTDSTLREILLSNHIKTHGTDVSSMRKTLLLSTVPKNIDRLNKLRSAILWRVSDEAWNDWRTITTIITQLRWRR